jgi:hypothetical protein
MEGNSSWRRESIEEEALHFMASRKQRKRGRVRRQDKSFHKSPVNYFFRRGPTSYFSPAPSNAIIL